MIQCSGHDNDGTIDGSESSQQSTNDAKWRGGGAKVRRHDEGRGHTHKNQTDYTEGGLDGDDEDKGDDDDDGGGHDDDDGSGHDNDEDDECGGQGGHHWMRKGREHDDRQKHNNQIDHRREGGRRW